MVINFSEIRKFILKENKSLLIKEISNSLKIQLLKECLHKLEANNFIEKNDMMDLNKLIEIYVENNLMMHATNLDFYQYAVRIILDGTKSFFNSFDQLNELNTKQKNVLYAKIWCAKNCNTAFVYCNYTEYYDPIRLNNKCENLYSHFSDFSKVHILAGECYAHRNDKANEAIINYRSALEVIKNKPYAYYAYYLMGMRYKRYDVRQAEAKYLFTQSYQKHKNLKNISMLFWSAYKNHEYAKAQKLQMSFSLF